MPSRSKRRGGPVRSRCRSPVRGRSPPRSRSPRGDKVLVRPRRPARPRPGARRRACSTTSPTCAGGCPARPSPLVQVDEPALPSGARRAGPDRLRLRPAPGGAPAGGDRGPRSRLRRDRRGRRRQLVNSCAPGFPIALARGAGAQGHQRRPRSARPGRVRRAGGGRRGRGVGAARGRCRPRTRHSAPRARREHARQVTERVLRTVDMLGLEPGPRLVVTPSCGLAGASPGLGPHRPRPRPPGRPRPRVLTPVLTSNFGIVPDVWAPDWPIRGPNVRDYPCALSTPEIGKSQPFWQFRGPKVPRRRDYPGCAGVVRGACGGVGGGAGGVGQPTWTTSGPSVASSSCLTSGRSRRPGRRPASGRRRPGTRWSRPR